MSSIIHIDLKTKNLSIKNRKDVQICHRYFDGSFKLQF